MKENENVKNTEQSITDNTNIILTMIIFFIVTILLNYFFIYWLSIWWLKIINWVNLNQEDLKTLVKSEMEGFESFKAWWKENFEILKEVLSSDFYKQQQKQQIQWMLNTIKWNWNNQQPAWDQQWQVVEDLDKQEFPSWIINADQIKQVIWNSFVYWNENSKYSIIEFSDIECPFCKKLYTDWSIQKLLQENSETTNFIFKNFPLSFHPNAFKAALSLECVWDIWWKEVYSTFKDKVFWLWDTSPSFDVILQIVDNINIDKKKFEQCVNNEKFKNSIETSMDLWTKLFWVNWTPWVVLLNNETWKFILLAWAYPIEIFKAQFEKIKN